MKPVSKTAYYCCGVRMTDAMSKSPLVNDTYAANLMGEEGMMVWEPFKKHVNPTASNIARCFIIDTWVKEYILENPQTTFILIGAGLDSRAYRMTGGNWIELDEPGVMEYKESKLAANQCKNPLQRISIDFEKETLRGKLLPFASKTPVVFIVEGVLMYLTQDQRKELLNTLVTLFKNHVLLCDLMSEEFFQKMARKGMYVEIQKLNASFKELMKDPKQLMLDSGYQLQEFKSNAITASDFGLLKIPHFIVKYLMKRLLIGYSCYRFRFG